MHCFDIVNIIIDNRIAEPKRIDDIYTELPTGALEAIEKTRQQGITKEPTRRLGVPARIDHNKE